MMKIKIGFIMMLTFDMIREELKTGRPMSELHVIAMSMWVTTRTSSFNEKIIRNLK